MDFAYHRSNEVRALRQKVRAFLDENYSPDLRERRFDRPHDKAFLVKWRAWRQETLEREGPAGEAIFKEEADRAGFFYMDFGPTELVVAVLRAVGGAHHLTLADRFDAGELTGCLGFSEPGSGSDIAAARTFASKDGGGWLISGQKMFTTLADHATHVLLLTRTNPDVPKHEGLTLFLVPLDAPGVEVQPIQTLVTHPTNMTYYDDVRVDDSARLGDVDGGWQLMKVALAVEQAGGRGAYTQLLLEATVEWLRERGPVDDLAKERLGRAFVDHEVGTLLGYRNIWAVSGGDSVETGWGQGAKLFATESYDRVARDLIALAGPEGLVSYETGDSAAGGWPNFAFRDAPVRRIAGGVSEVLRDYIAERRLGVPRLRPPA